MLGLGTSTHCWNPLHSAVLGTLWNYGLNDFVGGRNRMCRKYIYTRTVAKRNGVYITSQSALECGVHTHYICFHLKWFWYLHKLPQFHHWQWKIIKFMSSAPFFSIGQSSIFNTLDCELKRLWMLQNFVRHTRFLRLNPYKNVYNNGTSSFTQKVSVQHPINTTNDIKTSLNFLLKYKKMTMIQLNDR